MNTCITYDCRLDYQSVDIQLRLPSPKHEGVKAEVLVYKSLLLDFLLLIE